MSDKAAERMTEGLDSLLQRYLGQPNTPAVRASMREMIEAKLVDNYNKMVGVNDAHVEIDEEASLREHRIVARLRFKPDPPAAPAPCKHPRDCRYYHWPHDHPLHWRCGLCGVEGDDAE